MVTIKCHLETVSLPTSFSSFTRVELELDEMFEAITKSNKNKKYLEHSVILFVFLD